MIEHPRIPYWHLYTDLHGVTRQRLCHLEYFELTEIVGGEAPRWQGRSYRGEATVTTKILPVGWLGPWHEHPEPQWTVPLSGRWFVESMDGKRVEMGPGEISFGEDQGSLPHYGRSGHLSGTVGDAPAVLMLVQVNARRGSTANCPFA